jgi:FtsH-binding integral membrane protein
MSQRRLLRRLLAIRPPGQVSMMEATELLDLKTTIFLMTSRCVPFHQNPLAFDVGTDKENEQFGGSVAEATLDIRMSFIRKVYSILTVQLLLTAGLSSLSFFSDNYRNWIQSNSWLMWVSLFGAIGFMLLTYWKRKSYPTNMLFLAGFTGLEAYSISVITSFYESRIVLQALILTVGIFIGLTLFACQTKYDFTSWMPYLFGALWVLIIFGFMAAFFPGGKTIELVYGVVAALIFSGYILVDTQLVMRHYHVEEEIAASISLYLDILNLFLAILRILNSQNNN